MKWEYKTLTVNTKGWWGIAIDVEDFDNALNALGRDGWELVSVMDTNRANGRTESVVATFKRPIDK